MPAKPRDTKLTQELAVAKLPSGPMSESWSGQAPGSGQLHEVTPGGSRLLAEGFI